MTAIRTAAIALLSWGSLALLLGAFVLNVVVTGRYTFTLLLLSACLSVIALLAKFALRQNRKSTIADVAVIGPAIAVLAYTAVALSSLLFRP